MEMQPHRHKIKFRDLSGPIKFAVIMSWIYGVIVIVGMLFGFIGSLLVIR
jgi:hypothetical protein